MICTSYVCTNPMGLAPVADIRFDAACRMMQLDGPALAGPVDFAQCIYVKGSCVCEREA
jgi:hypothetical protein